MLKFLKRIKVVEDPRYTSDYPKSFGNRLSAIHIKLSSYWGIIVYIEFILTCINKKL